MMNERWVASLSCVRSLWWLIGAVSLGAACGPAVTLLKPDNRPLSIQREEWRSIIDDPENDGWQVSAAAWNAWVFGNDWDVARAGFYAAWTTERLELAGFGLAEVCTFGPCARQAAETWIELLQTSSPAMRRVAVHRLVTLLERVPGLARQTLAVVRGRLHRASGSERLDLQAAETILHQRVYGERLPLVGAPLDWRVDGPYPLPAWPVGSQSSVRSPTGSDQMAKPHSGGDIRSPRPPDTLRHIFSKTLRTRDVKAPLGELVLHPTAAGVFRAETSIDISAPGPYVLRISADCAVKLELDGNVLYDKNTQLSYFQSTQDTSIQLTFGRHHLVLWAETGHGGEQVVVQLVEDVPGSDSLDTPKSFPALLTAWLRATAALKVVDARAAEEELEKIQVVAPDWAALHTANAFRIEQDLSIPAEIRENLVDQELQWALSLDAAQVIARQQMIRRLVRKGAVQAAETLVRDGVQLQRSVAHEEEGFSVLGAQVADLQGYRPEAEAVLRGVVQSHPDSCEARRSLVEMLTDRPIEAKEWLNLPPGPGACPATIRMPTSLALRAGDGAAALRNVRALRAQEPEDDALFRDEIRALVLVNQHTEARELLFERLNRYPQLGEFGFWAADIAAELNDADTSRKEWSALSIGANVDSEHRRRLAVLGFDPILNAFRRNGADLAHRHEVSKTDGASAVYVLDDRIVVYFPDGSAAYRTHVLIQIRNEAAVDQLGELEVPFGAEMERVRTIKPDGRILEPEDIHEKESLSLVDLEVNDIIELASVRFEDPSVLPAPTRAAETFYFQSFDAPIVESRCVVVYADNLEPMFWVRSGGGVMPEAIPDLTAPPGFQVRAYRTRNLPQARLEPMAIQATKNLPRLTVATASWEQIRGTIAARLNKLRRIPNDLRKNVDEIRSSTKSEVDQVGDVFRLIRRSSAESVGEFLQTSSEHTWAKKSGERAILLWSALTYGGWDADFILVHPADNNDDDLRDGPNWLRYNYPVVRVRTGEEELWLDLTSGDNVFDYLPPSLHKRPGMDPFANGVHTEIWTPAFPAELELHTVFVNAYLSSDGELRGYVEEYQRGAMAMASRHFLILSDEEAALSAIQTRLGRSFPLATIDDVEIIDLREPDEPLRLRYSFAAPVANPNGRLVQELEFRIFPEELGKNYAALPQRTTPLWVNAPTVQDIVIHLTVAPPLKFEETPHSTSFHNSLTTLDVTVEPKPASKEGESLVIRKKWQFPAQIVEPEQYELLKATASRVDRQDRIRIGFGLRGNENEPN